MKQTNFALAWASTRFTLLQNLGVNKWLPPWKLQLAHRATIVVSPPYFFILTLMSQEISQLAHGGCSVTWSNLSSDPVTQIVLLHTIFIFYNSVTGTIFIFKKLVQNSLVKLNSVLWKVKTKTFQCIQHTSREIVHLWNVKATIAIA